MSFRRPQSHVCSKLQFPGFTCTPLGALQLRPPRQEPGWVLPPSLHAGPPHEDSNGGDKCTGTQERWVMVAERSKTRRVAQQSGCRRPVKCKADVVVNGSYGSIRNGSELGLTDQPIIAKEGDR